MGKRCILEKKINTLLEMFPVVALVGSRQCGKSTLVKQLRPEWKYYDLNSPDDYQLISSYPVALITFIATFFPPTTQADRFNLSETENELVKKISPLLEGSMDNSAFKLSFDGNHKQFRI